VQAAQLICNSSVNKKYLTSRVNYLRYLCRKYKNRLKGVFLHLAFMKLYDIRAPPIVKKVSTERVPLTMNMLYKFSIHSSMYLELVMEPFIGTEN
jgi:hypothetical protein